MSNACAWAALAPAAGQTSYCLAHLMACWVAPRRDPYLHLLLGFLAGLIVTLGAGLGTLAFTHSGPARDMIALVLLDLTAYLALAFGYFNFVNINIASLRIRMIEELLDFPQGLSREQLLASYNTEEVIAVRITRLVTGGHLAEHQGRFRLGGARRFVLLARIYDLLRRVILRRGILDR